MRVTVGVSGGIAAYKAAELARALEEGPRLESRRRATGQAA